MIRLLLSGILFLINYLVNAQTITPILIEEGVTITVQVHNISSNKGKVLFGLYNSEANFDQKISFASAIGTINAFKTEVSFEQIPTGTYAIICFHDENENNQMDFDNFMPLEDFGASNNPRTFGPPQFQASKFEIGTSPRTIEIMF
jgi:uncharacterized protein (DUF2141 family)